MTEPQAFSRFAQTALAWRDLIDQRCAHFIELHKSGRWKHYYDEATFLVLMREAVDLAEAWSRLAPRADEGPNLPRLRVRDAATPDVGADRRRKAA
jgi:hypothetical protein